jgi:hypothetical protein
MTDEEITQKYIEFCRENQPMTVRKRYDYRRTIGISMTRFTRILMHLSQTGILENHEIWGN